MDFGYFFLGVKQSERGASGHVEIRPLTDLAAVDAGMKVIVAVPLNTQRFGESLQAVASHCLQSAQQLLPESALAAWLQTCQASTAAQPTIPPDAQDRWEALISQP
ncbi:hypothetical protein A8M77_21015 [Variovorax sp. JS1663]|nr:hypothetical protein A8M77_21015 [Variovorax sp. JS1663]